jgi:hypothetical protein
VALDRLVREPPVAQVPQGRLAGGRLQQHGVVERDRRLHDLAQPRVPGVLALGPLVELDAGTAGELRERLGKRQRVALHDEREDVAVLPAAEAVPRVARRRHDEAGCLLAVERAQPLEGGARLLQLDRLPHHVGDGEAALDLGDDADGHGRPFPSGPADKPTGNDCRPVKS